MKKVFKISIIALLTALTIVNARAQNNTGEVNSYRLSVGVNYIDDTADHHNSSFANKNNMAVGKFPSRFAIEKIIMPNFSIEASLSLNKYMAGTVIDSVTIAEDRNFTAIDGHIKYSLYNLIKLNNHIEPYAMAGLGASLYNSPTYRDKKITYSYGAGVILWLNDPTKVDKKLNQIGIYGQALIKKVAYDSAVLDNITLTGNHIQFAVGLIIK